MSATSPADPRAAGGRAPGKVILLGEHAVVYGRAAIAASIERHTTVRVRPRGDGPATATAFAPRTIEALARAGALLGVDVRPLVAEVAGDLPTAVGLGSSAAFSVALVRALAASVGRQLGDAAVGAAALEIEKLFHGSPSGIDTSAATYGGIIVFRRGTVTRLPPAPPLRVVIALGGAPRRTQAVVAAVGRQHGADTARYEALFNAIEALTGEAIASLPRGDWPRLGRLMRDGHGLLRQLGVSTPELDAMVALADAHGALGAKLTGAGGGGAVLCLPTDDGRPLVAAFARAGWRAFTTDLRSAEEESHAQCFPYERGDAAR